MDESIDVANMKHVCILARYVHEGDIKMFLLDLVRVKAANSESLFLCLMYTLKKYNLPINNLIGFCANNTNVMMDKHNSVAPRLLEVNVEISIFPCIRHSFHLIARHAYEVLFKEFDNFLYAVYTYFAHSPKRQIALETKQKEMKIQQQKILKPSPTRWLSLHGCIERILMQWAALCAVFKDATESHESAIAARLNKNFNCPYMKAYLEFLILPLGLITNFIATFQKNDFVIHNMLSVCLTLVRHLAGFFIKRDYVRMENIYELNIDDQDNLLTIEETYIGEDAICTMNEIRNRNTMEDANKIKEFYETAQRFYKITFKELVRCIPFNETFLHSLNFLKPEIALTIQRTSRIQFVKL
nr:uncharacterized protein LOC117223097 [Megalopta genalis]